MLLAKLGINMKNFPTLKDFWENLDEQEKNKNKKVKGRGEGDVTLFLCRILRTVVGENT